MAAAIPAHAFNDRFEVADEIAAAGAGVPIAAETAVDAATVADAGVSNGGPVAEAAVISSIVAAVLVTAIPVMGTRAVLS